MFMISKIFRVCLLINILFFFLASNSYAIDYALRLKFKQTTGKAWNDATAAEKQNFLNEYNRELKKKRAAQKIAQKEKERNLKEKEDAKKQKIQEKRQEEKEKHRIEKEKRKEVKERKKRLQQKLKDQKRKIKEMRRKK